MTRELFEQAEVAITSLRSIPFPPSIEINSYAGFKAIHKHLFADIRARAHKIALLQKELAVPIPLTLAFQPTPNSMHEDHTQPEKEQIDYQNVIAQLNALQPYKALEQVHVERLGPAIRAAHRRGVGADALSAMLKKEGVNLSSAYLRKNVLRTNGKKTQRQKKKSEQPPHPIRKALAATNNAQGIAVAAKEGS